MIRVLIADDHEIVRAGLRQFIADEPDIQVTGEAGSGDEVMALLRNAEFDVVVLDISMPQRNGIDVLKLLRQRFADLPVLILSTYPEDQYAINLIRVGASGYLTKESAADELVKAIRTVVQGRRYVSAAVAELLIGGLGKPTEQSMHQSLSEREFQIFCKLSRGQTVSVIADELFLSVKTVSTYRSRILEKMGMKTNADLTYYAIKNGLVE
ncbi:DNA-binding response regulator [Cupriavidus sp. USMAHM13]|uniref:DNA-binding response regulator n=1 Tax=Cupriavidus malaysiensis TaxID=367825 RepID=A0ABM6F0S0_9BURK|nr:MULTISPECIES: response regulator transcription factor [Cupriavidus]AOY98388.1 DNA-binding response regulator [Cupriavidus sp. USMAHM13]AOZ04819.1 DNA-binding response regulator [Cupriavidus malaysiensis]